MAVVTVGTSVASTAKTRIWLRMLSRCSARSRRATVSPQTLTLYSPLESRRNADPDASGHLPETLWHHREHDVGRPRRRTIYALGRLDIVARHRPIYAGHEPLGIAVDQRKPLRLHLHHQPVSLEKHVIAVAQRNRPLDGRIRRERPGVLVARQVAPAADLHRHGQLVSIHGPGVLARAGAGLGIRSEE